MKITITLFADRTKPGMLHLLVNNLLALPAPCLGKADNATAIAKGNPTRNPILPYGDTPTGIYAPAKVLYFHPEHARMGRCAIPLIGIGGQALIAMRERKELYIHATPSGDAGRGEDKLIPTLGCIRLRDRDMAMLAEKLDGQAAEIEVNEVPTEA